MPIIITSKKHLFRRCEVAHPAQATEYPDGRFTDAQLEILKVDPMLTVETVGRDFIPTIDPDSIFEPDQKPEIPAKKAKKG